MKAEVLQAILDHKDKLHTLKDRIRENWEESLIIMEKARQPGFFFFFTLMRNRLIFFMPLFLYSISYNQPRIKKGALHMA